MFVAPGYEVFDRVFGAQPDRLFFARRQSDDRRVILKVASAGTTGPGADALLREYRLLKNLSSERIIGALDFSTEATSPVLVLDHFDQLLCERLAEGPLPPEQVARLGCDIALALADVHTAGVIHKDVRPSNVAMAFGAPSARLSGFGLSLSLTAGNLLCHPGLLAGGLPYISPEQTGRIGREADFRSDLYSLGATLYELLIGAPPFASDDPLELVHLHLAKAPTPPHVIDRRIPRALGNVVMKLLEKPPEKRYQTAIGLHADLLQILGRLESGQTVFEFQMGSKEPSDRQLVPDTLVGRKGEVEGLLRALERTRRGEPEMIVLAGPAGMGKTALAHILEPEVSQLGGFFATAEFEPTDQGAPLAAFAHAAAALVRQLLTRSDELLASWRAKVPGALHDVRHYLVELVPNLDRILPPGASAPQSFHGNPYELGLLELIRSFADPERPLVLSLDSLERADSQSLALLQKLVLQTDAPGLLVVGAYRDDHAGRADCETWLRKNLATRRLSKLALGPLARSDVIELLGAAFDIDASAMAPLIAALEERTGNNPLALRHTLAHWHGTGALRYDGQRGWVFDEKLVDGAIQVQTTVGLLMETVARLPNGAREVLKLASTIGTRFDLATLVGVSDGRGPSTVSALYRLITEGLVLADGDGYHFAHEGVREAAERFLTDAERTRYRLRIARQRLGGATPEELDRDIFDIVDHFNAGAASIEKDAERLRLADLNLVAARRAIATRSFDVARNYATAGLVVTRESGCVPSSTIVALHMVAAQAAELSGSLETALRDFETLLETPLPLEQRGLVAARLVEMYTKAGDRPRAVLHGRQALAALGVDVPLEPSRRAIARARRRALDAVSRAQDTGDEAPAGDAAQREGRVALVTALERPASETEYRMANLLAAVGAETALDPCASPRSARAIAWFAATIAPHSNLFSAMRLAMRLNQQAEPAERPAVDILIHAHVAPACAPLDACFESLAAARAGALEVSDSRSAVTAALNQLWFGFSRGQPLSELEAAAREAVTLTSRIGSPTSQAFATWFEGVCRAVRARKPETGSAPSALAMFGEASSRSRVGQSLIAAHIACVFDDAALAVRCIEAAANEKPYFALPFAPYYAFLRGLSLAMRASSADEDDADSWKMVRRCSRRLALWARSAPMNFEHLSSTLAAELLAHDGAPGQAMEAFARAAALARKGGFLHDASIIAHRRASLARRLGYHEDERLHAEQAMANQVAWTVTPWRSETHKVQALPNRVEPAPEPAPQRHFASHHLLDLKTVLRATQAISRETSLEGVLERVMASAIENAGAQRGAVLLPRGGTLSLEFERGIFPEETKPAPAPLDQCEDRLPVSVVKYVMRTHETVVLGDASEVGLFTHDPYVKRTRARSVLSAPILTQNKLAGVFYLENALVAEAFSEERLEILGMLSAQAAISMESARLYDELRQARHELEQRVAERTKELREANGKLRTEVEERRRAQLALEELQTELVTAARRAGMAEVATGVLHNVGNVLNSVNVATTVLADRIGKSRLPGLGRAVSLLSEHSHDLGRFLTEDRRGPLLLSYLTGLSAHLDEEHRTMSEEVALILRNINHIRDIVSAQQAFAGIGGVVETVAPLDLIGEAIRICGASRPWKDQRAVVHGDDVRAVTVDKHRVLQILVNLVTNARESMDENHGSDGVVRIGVHDVGDATFTVSVSDTGIGIDAEHLSRIFTHGFTTKKRGHGFGLHSSANAARELGGSLRVESAGIGLGATFHLELPRRHATAGRRLMLDAESLGDRLVQ